VRESERVEKRTFINPEQFKEEMRRMKERQFMFDRHRHEHFENEVKLFTDRDQMVDYVNHLSHIENVDIFKIEENLYKVLVTRRRKTPDQMKEE
jgi:hypothetical protein